jgi:hypothetical protein
VLRGYPVFFSGRANPSKNEPGIFFPENDIKTGQEHEKRHDTIKIFS